MATQETKPVPTELCNYGIDNRIECISQLPELKGLFNYPEVFIVPSGTCSVIKQ